MSIAVLGSAPEKLKNWNPRFLSILFALAEMASDYDACFDLDLERVCRLSNLPEEEVQERFASLHHGHWIIDTPASIPRVDPYDGPFVGGEFRFNEIGGFVCQNDLERMARGEGPYRAPPTVEELMETEKNDPPPEKYHCARELRLRVIRAFKNTCNYCGVVGNERTDSFGRWWHIDRIIPGGPYSPENVALACVTCNVTKHANHPLVKIRSLADIEAGEKVEVSIVN